jgi:hypothetical protein
MTELELLEKRIKRSALQDMFIGLLLLLMAALVVVGAVTQWNSPNGKPWFMVLLGLMFVGVAWLMVNGGLAQWNPRATRLYLAVTGDTKDVVWVHLTRGSVNAMKVHFSNGEVTTVHASRKDGERLLGFMLQRAPHAIFGFGPEQQKAYFERLKARRP